MLAAGEQFVDLALHFLRDLLRIHFKGPMNFEDARQVLPIFREVWSQRPRYFVADISESALDAATRKHLGAEVQPEWFLGAVFVGANLMLRILTNALNSLIQFHRGSDIPMRFVANEAEAFEVIEAWRAQRDVPSRDHRNP